jgi:glutamine synthetase
MAASFMPKPFLERSGGGMHVHVSLAESMPFFAPHIDAFRRATRTSKSVIACTFPPISRKSASRPCMR